MIYSKIRGEGMGGSLQQGLATTPIPLPKPSQGDVDMRTDAQIKFLYYPL